MKTIQTAGKFLATLVLLLFAAGCASSLEDKENLAVAANFKVITPTTPDQKALLKRLSVNKVTRVNQNGKTYYILPDLAHNQAYVGGPKQWQSYQQLLKVQQQNAKMLSAQQEATQLAVEEEQVDSARGNGWGEWGGWGDWEGASGTAGGAWY